MEEKINLNFVKFIDKLTKYGIYTDAMKADNDFNEKLKVASAFLSEDSGYAYEGSLIDHTTNVAVFAYKINELFPNSKIPVNSLIKVCYLHQIGKVFRIIKNENDWEVKNGKLFSYNKNSLPIKTSEYTIYLCYKYGIEFTEEEYEAMLSVEKQNDDQNKYFGSMFSHILNSAIDLVNTEGRLRFKQVNKK